MSCVLWAPAAMCAAEPIEALTAPSRDLLLSFNQIGKIASIPVKEGDHVKVGQVLVQQDDLAEKVSQEYLKLAADDHVKIKAAEAQLEQSKLDLKNLQYALDNNAATQYEVDHAVLEVTIKVLTLELQNLEHRQAGLKYQEISRQIERMVLVSPVDGKVERIVLREGETADPQTKVIRIVKLDPLWIDVPAPLTACRNLRVGQNAQVIFPDLEEPLTGRIVFIAAVAEPGSETLTVRVELPNPQERRAGERVKIGFPASENTQPASAPSEPPKSE